MHGEETAGDAAMTDHLHDDKSSKAICFKELVTSRGTSLLIHIP